MTNFLVRYSLIFGVLAILVYIVLWSAVSFFDVQTPHLPINSIFLFHTVVTVLICAQLYLLSIKMPTQVGFLFLGMIALKMVLIAMYLKPYLMEKVPYDKGEVLLFAMVYFVFLTFESIFTIKLISRKTP